MTQTTIYMEARNTHVHLDSRDRPPILCIYAICPFSRETCYAQPRPKGGHHILQASRHYIGLHYDQTRDNHFFKFTKHLLAPEQVLQALDIPVPSAFLEAIGFSSEARHIGLFWQPAGDEFRCGDGRTEVDGSYSAWLQYCRHPRIYPHLAPYHFGSSDSEAIHWLIIDTATLSAFCGERKIAEEVLQDQWLTPGPDPIIVTSEHYAAERAAFESARYALYSHLNNSELDQIDVFQRLRQQDQLNARLIQELDKYPKKPST